MVSSPPRSQVQEKLLVYSNARKMSGAYLFR